MKHPVQFMASLLLLTACASKPPPNSPASTDHSDTAPKTSVEAEQVAAEENAAFVTEIKFNKDSSHLTQEARADLEKLLQDAEKSGKISEIKTIAWADSEYPSPAIKKLAKKDENLADARNRSVEKVLKARHQNLKVESYNMTARPNLFKDWLSTSDAKIKKALETAGIPNTDTSVKVPAKSGKAMVMVILEK